MAIEINKYAPIVIPTLCRSVHFIRLIESLKRNSWARFTDVFIGLDYPPSEKYKKGWEEINEYLCKEDFSVFSSFSVIRREHNFGAEENYRSLINEVLSKYDRFIYAEDDLEVSPNFLEYMDKTLSQYESDSNIIAVTGYSHPIKWNIANNATLFRQNYSVPMWGTGFWKDKWEILSKDIISGGLQKHTKSVFREKRYKWMLDATLSGYIPSILFPHKRFNKWMLCVCDVSLRTYLSVYNKYIISPTDSKVRNFGFDGSGLYCQSIDETINGETARTYNYSKQVIDQRNTFEIIEDKDDIKKVDNNSSLLNTFDYRTPQEMRIPKAFIWVIEHFGLYIARMLYLPFFAIDTLKLIKDKIKRLNR